MQVQFLAGVEIAALATDAMPYDAALAIDTSGHAWGWGNNLTSALCQGSGAAAQYLTPVEIPLPDVTLVAGASGHAIFNSNGSLYACGLYQDGSLGDGKSSGTAYTPVAVVGTAGSGRHRPGGLLGQLRGPAGGWCLLRLGLQRQGPAG